MANQEPLKIKIINDPIHGVLELNEVYMKIIDTKEFQRLRNIKQLGGVQYVYPSATHTRFEHSLGVCYLAELMAKTLQRNQPDLNITQTEVLCIGIAGLCHDLGHGPFSHTWEEFMKRVRRRRNWQHEETSFEMFLHLWRQLPRNIQDQLNDTDLQFIKELIKGVPEHTEEEWTLTGRHIEKCFLYDIVSNKKSGVDVDKWDYFLRDCHYLGFKDTFDYRRLLQCAYVLEDNGVKHICFRDKEILNLYDMFHTRWELHRKACYHRVSRCVEEMIIDVLLKVDEIITIPGRNGRSQRRALSRCCEDMDNFKNLDDTIFDRIFFESQHLDNTSQNDREDTLIEARAVIHRIKERNLYKELCYIFVDNLDNNAKEELLSRAEQDEVLGRKQDVSIRIDEITYGKEEKDPIQLVRFYNKRRRITPQTNRNFGSEMLPSRFKQQMLSCICKSTDRTVQDNIRRSFNQLYGSFVVIHNQLQ